MLLEDSQQVVSVLEISLLRTYVRVSTGMTLKFMIYFGKTKVDDYITQINKKKPLGLSLISNVLVDSFNRYTTQKRSLFTLLYVTKHLRFQKLNEFYVKCINKVGERVS